MGCHRCRSEKAHKNQGDGLTLLGKGGEGGVLWFCSAKCLHDWLHGRLIL